MTANWTRTFLISTAATFAFYALAKDVVGPDGTPAIGFLITVCMLGIIASAIPRRPKGKDRVEDAE